jgi:hypothetical protein
MEHPITNSESAISHESGRRPFFCDHGTIISAADVVHNKLTMIKMWSPSAASSARLLGHTSARRQFYALSQVSSKNGVDRLAPCAIQTNTTTFTCKPGFVGPAGSNHFSTAAATKAEKVAAKAEKAAAAKTEKAAAAAKTVSYFERKEKAKETRTQDYVTKLERIEQRKIRREGKPMDVLRSEFRPWWEKRKAYEEMMERFARKAGLDWKIEVAVILERIPVVFPDKEDWETEYEELYAYLAQFGKEYPKEFIGEMNTSQEEYEPVFTEDELIGKSCYGCKGRT